MVIPACGPVRLIAGDAQRVEGHRDERRALVLAGGEEDVELARVRLVGDRGGQAEQLVRGVAHRGDDDDEVVAGGALAGDPARDALDAVRAGDRRTAEFLDDEGGGHRGRILPPEPSEPRRPDRHEAGGAIHRPRSGRSD